MSTTIEFDLLDEQAAAGLAPASGYLMCRFVNEVDDPDSDGIITTKPFRVTITDGVGEADIVPTPVGNALSVRSYVRGVRSRYVLIPDSPTPVEFRDLTEVDPDSLDPVTLDPAWVSALADEEAAREEGDAARIVGAAVSTDASFGLTTPTGTGLEFVIVADALDDIRWNGASL